MGSCNYCGNCVDCDDEYQTGWDDGHAAGRDEGFEEGFRAAWTRARELALGVVDDNDDLYANLYTTGKAKGHAAGYRKGHAEGFDDGYAEGLTDGKKEGRQVGYSEGHEEGFADGHIEGVREVLAALEPALAQIWDAGPGCRTSWACDIVQESLDRFST